MNPDPEIVFALTDPQAPVSHRATRSVPAAPVQDAGIRPECIVGDHFFWASSSVLHDLS